MAKEQTSPETPVGPAIEPPLGPALLRAAEWFNEAFAQRVADLGWPRLSSSQVQLLLHLDPDGTTPAELARRLHMTRQSMRELLGGMAEHGLIATAPHPHDARSQLVTATPRALELGMDAARTQVVLDEILAGRIGHRRMRELRSVLEMDWGPPPVSG